MLKSIMKTAWNLFRTKEGFYTFAECLKMAWAAVRGYKVAFCISTDGGRVIASAVDFETANRVRRDTIRNIVARGSFKVFGDNVTTVRVIA